MKNGKELHTLPLQLFSLNSSPSEKCCISDETVLVLLSGEREKEIIKQKRKTKKQTLNKQTTTWIERAKQKLGLKDENGLKPKLI